MGTGSFRLATPSVRWVIFASRPAPWRRSMPRPAGAAARACAYGVAPTRDPRREPPQARPDRSNADEGRIGRHGMATFGRRFRQALNMIALPPSGARLRANFRVPGQRRGRIHKRADDRRRRWLPAIRVNCPTYSGRSTVRRDPVSSENDAGLVPLG